MGCLNTSNSHEELNLYNLDGGNAPNKIFDDDSVDDNQKEEIIVVDKPGYQNSNSDLLRVIVNHDIENRIAELRQEAEDYDKKMSDYYNRTMMEEGNKYKRLAKEKNDEAKKMAFDYKNELRSKDVIDLQLLLPGEIIEYLEERVNKLQVEKITKLTIIYGYQSNDKSFHIDDIVKNVCIDYLDSKNLNYSKGYPNNACLTILF